jgi:hypothetical protein
MTDASRIPLQMTLGDVAVLASVQRPVVSMWRTRSAHTDAPFPAPFAIVRGEERFDAEHVVAWLEFTSHGKNPNAREDAAAFAMPQAFSVEDVETVLHGLTALLCLKVVSGESLTNLTAQDLIELADEADPDDEFMLSEIEGLGDRLVPFSRYADALSDAAYNPAAAFEQLMRERLRLILPGRASVALHQDVRILVAKLAAALAFDSQLESLVYVDPTHGGSDLLVSLLAQHAEPSDLTVLTAAHDDPVSRLVRRRMRVHGVQVNPLLLDGTGAFEVADPAVHLAQYPSPGRPSMTNGEILTAVDNIALQMDDSHRAVVLAPSSALSDRLPDQGANMLRDSLLRDGRVRAIVRLPKGLLLSKPRQPMALWVLGPAYGDVPLAERWTMVADLTDVPLDDAVIGDLVSDLVLAMGHRSRVAAHAVRFIQVVRTSDLHAARGDLVVRRTKAPLSSPPTGAELALRLAELQENLTRPPIAEASLALSVNTVDEPPWPARLKTLGMAVAEKAVRVVPGTRLDAAHVSRDRGVRLIGPEELSGLCPVGERHIDRLVFSAAYPAGRYTEPGDVVFCTTPRPRALVDNEGGSVVVFPARIMRIDRRAQRGIMPDVLAGDINGQPDHAKTWRLWPVRQIPDDQYGQLTTTLEAILRQRDEALARLSALDELTDLLTQGVAARALTLSDTEHEPLKEGD